MNFIEAMAEVKAGKKMCRVDWNNTFIMKFEEARPHKYIAGYKNIYFIPSFDDIETTDWIEVNGGTKR